MLPDRAARRPSATRAARALAPCATGCRRRRTLDRGATELSRRQSERLLHGRSGTRRLHALEQGIEFVREGVQGELFPPDQRAVFLDRNQHRARLVMLGNGKSPLSGDAIEDPPKAI